MIIGGDGFKVKIQRYGNIIIYDVLKQHPYLQGKIYYKEGTPGVDIYISFESYPGITTYDNRLILYGYETLPENGDLSEQNAQVEISKWFTLYTRQDIERLQNLIDHINKEVLDNADRQ